MKKLLMYLCPGASLYLEHANNPNSVGYWEVSIRKEVKETRLWQQNLLKA
jgi:hypothetical protein